MAYGKSAIALDESAICSRWFSSKDMLCSSSAGEVVCLCGVCLLCLYYYCCLPRKAMEISSCLRHKGSNMAAKVATRSNHRKQKKAKERQDQE